MSEKGNFRKCLKDKRKVSYFCIGIKKGKEIAERKVFYWKFIIVVLSWQKKVLESIYIYEKT